MSTKDMLQDARGELWVKAVGDAQVGVHLGFLDHDSGKLPARVTGQGGHDRIPVDLLIGGRVEAVEIVSLLEQSEAEGRKVAREGSWIVGPGGREDVVPAAGRLEGEVPRLVEMD